MSHTLGGQVLISPSTFERIRDIVLIRATMDVQFKGIDQPVTLYDVAGMKGAYQFHRRIIRFADRADQLHRGKPCSHPADH